MDMIERACRALCRYNGVAPDTEVGGVPLWQSYRTEVLALVAALRKGDELPSGLCIEMKRKPVPEPERQLA
ncbi:hypothetical protein [Labrys monachus]|uniref:Uncharacterized protein n=1 Tax=Labrys monachus TaxID=217067 RepID=A0ABU0FL20_9HYPH|nr:hypothetical protein [Labrys monachus]MDQ0395303.1 hypothetical protein [Labrys monachus]